VTDGGDPANERHETLPSPASAPRLADTASDLFARPAREREAPPRSDSVGRAADAWRKTSARLANPDLLMPANLRATPGARRVGRYELREPLGQGGCGMVYRAWDPKHEREVALKLVNRSDDSARIRFEREIKATARLRHQGVVSLLDSGEHDGQLFIVTELVVGGSLAGLLEREGRLPPERAARVLRDIAVAIHYAHGEGVLHRDLKPHNVLLDDDDRARVVDFGLARLDDKARVTATGTTLGTPAYMSPEQIDARGLELDARCDVYGLGATLYHALTGQPPFDADSVEELFHSVLCSDAPPPSTLAPAVPADLDTIVLKCLDKEPGRRYPDAAVLAADLERFLGGEPVLARRASPLAGAWRWARQNPLVAVMGGLLVVVSLALVVVMRSYLALLQGR
jgi:serine/threonine-protein kinase